METQLAETSLSERQKGYYYSLALAVLSSGVAEGIFLDSNDGSGILSALPGAVFDRYGVDHDLDSVNDVRLRIRHSEDRINVVAYHREENRRICLIAALSLPLAQ